MGTAEELFASAMKVWHLNWLMQLIYSPKSSMRKVMVSKISILTRLVNGLKLELILKMTKCAAAHILIELLFIIKTTRVNAAVVQLSIQTRIVASTTYPFLEVIQNVLLSNSKFFNVNTCKNTLINS